MIEKAKIFVFDAGKVIMVISLLVWGLSSYGPPKKMQAVATEFDSMIQNDTSRTVELTRMKKTALLQSSFAGTLGKAIEPAITPLGYDWKIGIALITSFAAREVFVGTMATLYSVGEDDANNSTLRQKMNAAVREDGTKVYTACHGLIIAGFLCAGHAMYEHNCGCKTRNTKLEMADDSSGLHDGPGIFDELGNLRDI